MTTQFTIAGARFTFEVETDGGQLVSLTAVDGEFVYDCSLQLVPRDESKRIECCRPSGCTSGTC